MEVTVKIINAFSIGNTGGNPAGVVLNAENLTPGQKQAVASRAGLSETAFVSPSAMADYKLEFFTQTKQIAHCGHATVAVFSYLKQTGNISSNHSSKETIDGIRNIYFEGTEAYMEQKAPTYLTPEGDTQKTLTSLNLTKNDLAAGSEPVIVNTGNSFLLIEVKDETVLQKLAPDFKLIETISGKYNLIGFYVFTTAVKDNDLDATARMFAPLYGIEEEAATGMAAGPLACYLYQKKSTKSFIQIEQGKFMNIPSPSLLKVNINVKDTKITNLYAGGSAHISHEMIIEI